MSDDYKPKSVDPATNTPSFSASSKHTEGAKVNSRGRAVRVKSSSSAIYRALKVIKKIGMRMADSLRKAFRGFKKYETVIEMDESEIPVRLFAAEDQARRAAANHNYAAFVGIAKIMQTIITQRYELGPGSLHVPISKLEDLLNQISPDEREPLRNLIDPLTGEGFCEKVKNSDEKAIRCVDENPKRVLGQLRSPISDAYFSYQADSLDFALPRYFSSAVKPQHSNPSDDHAALTSPKVEPYRDKKSGDWIESEGMLRCKGYLGKREISGDYIRTLVGPDYHVAVVTDAAGNKSSSFTGAKKLAHELSDGLYRIAENSEGDAGVFKTKLGVLLKKLHRQMQAEVKANNAKATTAAFSITFRGKEGKNLVVGGTMGDARAMLVQNSKVENLTISDYAATYTNSGGSFGAEDSLIVGEISRGNRPLQLFAREIDEGDTLILGSDGMGDNLEAKTMGVSPGEVYNLLREAGKLGSEFDYTMIPDNWNPNEDSKEILQELHNAFVEYQSERILLENSKKSTAEKMFYHFQDCGLIAITMK